MPALSPTEIAQLAHRAGFRGRDLEVAVAVALAESGGRAGVNAHGGEDSRGLWQINSAHFGRLDEDRLYRPPYNAEAAYAVWRESRSFRSDPWHAWTTYTTGAYRRYLPQAQRAAARRPWAHGGNGGGRNPGEGNGGSGNRDSGTGGGNRDRTGRAELRPWRVPRNRAGRTGRVVYSPAFLKQLAARFTEYLAIAEQVDRRSRHIVDELAPEALVLAGRFAGEIRQRARDATDDREGTRRLPRLLTRDVGFLVEFRRRVLGLDAERGFGRSAITALIRPLPGDVFRARSRRRLRRLLGQLGPDGRSGAGRRLPTTPTGSDGPRLAAVKLTPAWRGTESIFQQFVTPFLRRRGLEPGSQKRPYDTVSGPAMSDHFTGSRNAYAVDYPTGSGEDEARTLARRMGNPDWRPNSYDSFPIRVDGERFRVQILWGSAIDHGDHVHVGIARQ